MKTKIFFLILITISLGSCSSDGVPGEFNVSGSDPEVPMILSKLYIDEENQMGFVEQREVVANGHSNQILVDRDRGFWSFYLKDDKPRTTTYTINFYKTERSIDGLNIVTTFLNSVQVRSYHDLRLNSANFYLKGLADDNYKIELVR